MVVLTHSESVPAFSAGLLREAGPAFQFRHAKLQDRLAQLYDTVRADGPDRNGQAG